jgi:hypothetical protein
MIDLSAAGMIEVLESADDTADTTASRPSRRPPRPRGSAAPPPGGEPQNPDADTKPPGLVETGR